MNEICLAFDTSNYTTSVAWFNGAEGKNSGRLLEVPEGRLGLRQSEALFAHVKRLPEVTEVLGLTEEDKIIAVGAASKPREGEDSYMPCFLAGLSQGCVMAAALDLPFRSFSHQQGHIAAAAWSAGRLDLLDRPHLAWHLSGGTTELLLVEPLGRSITCKVIGGTGDLAAGQIIDRTGGMLGLRFPSGRVIDELACAAVKHDFFAPNVSGLRFSFSGLENKIQEYYYDGRSKEDASYFALRSVISAVEKATKNAQEQFGDLPVLFSGGVTANSLMREHIKGIYSEPRYSSDNAMGVAVLTHRSVCK